MFLTPFAYLLLWDLLIYTLYLIINLASATVSYLHNHV